MKRYLLSAAALCFAMAMSAQSLFVGSYNIRYHNSDDDRNGNGVQDPGEGRTINAGTPFAAQLFDMRIVLR